MKEDEPMGLNKGGGRRVGKKRAVDGLTKTKDS